MQLGLPALAATVALALGGLSAPAASAAPAAACAKQVKAVANAKKAVAKATKAKARTAQAKQVRTKKLRAAKRQLAAARKTLAKCDQKASASPGPPASAVPPPVLSTPPGPAPSPEPAPPVGPYLPPAPNPPVNTDPTPPVPKTPSITVFEGTTSTLPHLRTSWLTATYDALVPAGETVDYRVEIMVDAPALGCQNHRTEGGGNGPTGRVLFSPSPQSWPASRRQPWCTGNAMVTLWRGRETIAIETFRIVA